MYFKSIELLGFKSFVDKAEFSFQPGITSIVGPNGCGKSNLMDAIRWVLGEQSAKGLRGNRMEDVIFNGSASRKPVGMAEVSLNLVNNGSLPVEYKELQITRRLFRSGESLYLINKNPCRLKDITDLFLDTGLGYHAYSLVEQGKVDFLLSSKPAERRLLVEEAAGIMKYKTRKKEALAKLELTRQNLLRISDITAEVKRQLQSLQRQAGRARRYKKLEAEEQHLIVLLAGDQYLNCQRQADQLKGEQQQAKDVQLTQNTQLANLESEKESLELELLDLGEQLSDLQKTKHQQELQENSALERKQHLKEMLAELGRQEQAAETEMVNLREQLAQLKEEKGRQQHTLADVSRTLSQGKTRLEEEQKKARELEALVLEQRRQLDEQKSKLLEIESKLVQTRNRMQFLQAEEQKLDRRRQQQEKEQKLLAAEQAVVAQQLEKLRQEQLQREKQLEQLVTHNKEFQHQSDIKLRQTKELDKQLLSQREKYNRNVSHLASLKDIQRNLEGFQEGVRKLLLADSPLPGLLGLVAQIIETDPQYELAIETILGSRLEYIMVEDQASAILAVKHLEQEQLGRGSFIPATLPEPTQINFPNPAEGLIGRAFDLVNCAESHASLAQYLLGTVWLAEDLEAALVLWEQAQPKPNIVTVQGQLIYANGVISGGSPGSSRSGFLSRQRKLKELQAEIDKLEGDIAEASQAREKLAAELSALHQKHTQAEKEQHQLQISLVSLEKDLQRWQAEKQRQEKQAATLDMEAQQLQLDAQGLTSELGQLAREQSRLSQSKEKARLALSELGQQYQDNEQQLSSQQELLTEDKVQLASLQTRQENLKAELERLQKEEKQVSQLINLRQQQRKENQTKQLSISKETEQLREQEGSLVQEGEDLEEKLLACEQRHQEKNSNMNGLEQNIKEARGKQSEQQKRLGELEVELVKLHLQLEEAQRQIAPTGQSLEQVMGMLSSQEFNPQESREKLEKTRQTIGRLGPVNLMALEEVETLEERYDFLARQQQDLEQSSTSLHEAISKINRTSRERLRATFEQVNEKFKKLCQSLFEGGEGELHLVDDEDLLESGVEIMVRPVGKRLRQMSLLSGGEKAMAAIAFLFAIYLVKPSPLCFLDEVDAPLDEANIGRLLKIIKDLSNDSQFIIITHNPRTMEASDLLYGITMETPGISKVVSVKFVQDEAKMN